MKKIVLLLIIALSLFSCEKRELKTSKLEIVSETIITKSTTAEIKLRYKYPYSSIDYLVCYISKDQNMIEADCIYADINDSVIIVKMRNLDVNTSYYYQYEYSNGIDIIKTNLKYFKTNDYCTPYIETSEITNITISSAKGGGLILDNGGLEVTTYGICWGTHQNPTTDDYHISEPYNNEVFTFSVLDLILGTNYYVRAYAINEMGIGYGETKCFTTRGLFSVNTSKKVCFSHGNLQYQASTRTWRFAEQQYDFIGDQNSNISPTYDGWIDLFGWGTSNHNHGAVCYQPYSTSDIPGNYYAYGNETYNLYDKTGLADWGYNAISNGGNTTNQWRTLTDDEWRYVLLWRNTNCGLRYVKAEVIGINGILILPDDWTNSIYILKETTPLDNYYLNIIDETNWSALEQLGVVFLPAAGKRGRNVVEYAGFEGAYWSSTQSDIYNSDGVFFYVNHFGVGGNSRFFGQSVRLVCDAN